MRKLKRGPKGNKGFTLVEIMIVVAVISVLSIISIPNIIRSRLNANEAAAQSMVKTLMSAANAYRAVNPTYPEDISDLAYDTPPYIGDAVAGAGTTEPTVEKNGYSFTISGDQYNVTVTATPLDAGVTGGHIFTLDLSGEITSEAVRE